MSLSFHNSGRFKMATKYIWLFQEVYCVKTSIGFETAWPFRILYENKGNQSTRRAQTIAKGAHILKISSKSVHKFLSYLVHKKTHTKLTNPQTNPGKNIISLAEVINQCFCNVDLIVKGSK